MSAARRWRADPTELRRLPLRAHELLEGVPLHDVWRIRLQGGGSPLTAVQVVESFARLDPTGAGPVVRGLFALRAFLGWALGWDRDDPSSRSRSYVERLTARDRQRSAVEPGSSQGFWTALYAFENEALGEVINRTVHAFLLFVVEPAPDGATLYWGVYVKPVGPLTRCYMALIDPFRRHLVYPTLIRRFEAAWREQHRGDSAAGSG